MKSIQFRAPDNAGHISKTKSQHTREWCNNEIINPPKYWMVKQKIYADILLIACIFTCPFGAWKNIMQLTRKKHFIWFIVFAANRWENRIVSITITADRRQTLYTGDDYNSLDHHVMITSSLKTATNCLAGALYVLNNCPIHSRYVRRGIGKRQVYQAEQFFSNDNDQVGTLIYM